jgi:gas vesicle protein
MNAHTQEHRDYGFVFGLLTGTVASAGLMMWLAPRTASELRRRMTDSARSLGKRASQQYEQASTRVGEAAAELAQKGRDVREDVSEAVARGAHEAERFVTAARGARVTEASGARVIEAGGARVTEGRKHPAADRSASTPHSV